MKKKTLLLTSWVNPFRLILILIEVGFLLLLKHIVKMVSSFINNIVSED